MTRQNLRRIALVIFTSLMVVPAAVLATTEHTDPAAPCFQWPAKDWDEDGVFDRLDRCNNTPHGCIVDKCPDTPAGARVSKSGCTDAQQNAMMRRAPVAERPPVTPQPAAPPVMDEEVRRQLETRGKIRLENVYFEKNSSKILPESEDELNRLAQGLEKFPELRFEIEGHTDTRGSASYNLRLSQERADAVRHELIQRGVAADRLTAKGYGESQPMTQERNEEEVLRNRRVEMRVLNPEALPGVKVEQKN